MVRVRRRDMNRFCEYDAQQNIVDNSLMNMICTLDKYIARSGERAYARLKSMVLLLNE